jgi:VWFA-related protein
MLEHVLHSNMSSRTCAWPGAAALGVLRLVLVLRDVGAVPLVGRRVGLILLGLGASSVGASALQPSGPPVFQADVALVTAPVFVTDGSGRAVAGLAAEDFEVFDGGTRVPIVAFQAIDVDALATAPAGDSAAPALPVAVQAAAARQFLLLFDLAFSPPSGLLRAREAASQFVQESLAPGDLVAVGTFGSNGVRMLTGFTSDRAYVARAIQGLGLLRALEMGPDPLGLGASMPRSGADGRAEVADQEIAQQMTAMRQVLLRQYQEVVRQFYLSMQDLARALAPLRGRKQVVLFSGGHLQRAWAGGSANAPPIQLFGMSREDPLAEIQIKDEMRKLFARAGANDVAFHTVNLAGIESPVDLASDDGRNLSRGEGVLALAAVADNTGGRRILATNDFARALREVDEVSRHYYVLAFQPADPPPVPDKPRAVKIRVKREGVRVSHRATYVVPKPDAARDTATGQIAAAEAIAKGLSGGPVRLQLTAMPYRDRQGTSTVPVVLHVDGETLVTEARAGKVPLQVYGYVLTEGSVVDSAVLSTTVDASGAAGAVRGGISLLGTFAARTGPVDLRFFVRVGTSGLTGALRKQVEIPAFAGGQLVASAALAPRPAAGKLVARLDTDARAPREIPFRIGPTPFLPESVPVLRAGAASEMIVFVWPSRGALPMLEVAGELRRIGQPSVPVRLEAAPRVVVDPDGFDRYLLDVVAPQVTPGQYAIHFTFRDPATGSSVSSTTTGLLEP